MKIFVTFLATSTLILASADIGSKTSYNYVSNNNVPQSYYVQQQEQQQQDPKQPQYPTNNIIPNGFLNLNTQYLPPPQTQHQHQTQAQVQYQHNPDYVAAQKQPQQQQQQQQFVIPLPMPADFPAKFSYQPAINSKTSRRYRPRVRIAKNPIVTKHFFIHSAPEETQTEIDEELVAMQQEQQPRKHYNVLFVKTPSQTNKAAALNLAKALKEEKTVVYVLAKTTSAADLQDALKESPQHINKPEVFFIRYRTAAEAANAQHQIQSQYDSLGGSTIISDEGIAPATIVVGSLDAPAKEDEEDQEQAQQPFLDNMQEQVHTTGNNNNGYLPPLTHN